MAATPVYSNGTWGEVVAVVYNGETITPETDGAVFYEERETVYEKDGCLPATVINKVAFQAIKPWDVLEADGLLPDLTAIPEPDEVKLARLKGEKAFALETVWAARVAAGVSVGGISYGITQGDVSLLTGAFVLAQTAVTTGAISADGPFTLIDISGVPHDYTMTTLTVAMLTYGQARSALSREYAVLAATIEAASTVAEVQAITISFS